MKKHVTLIVLGALAWGCGSIRSEHVLTGRQEAPYAGDVQVVMEGAPQPGGVQEIAILQVVANGNKAELSTALGELKTKAKSLGCDVVVNVRVDRSNTMSVTGVCGRRGGAPAGVPAAVPGGQSSAPVPVAIVPAQSP